MASYMGHVGITTVNISDHMGVGYKPCPYYTRSVRAAFKFIKISVFGVGVLEMLTLMSLPKDVKYGFFYTVFAPDHFLCVCMCVLMLGLLVVSWYLQCMLNIKLLPAFLLMHLLFMLFVRVYVN